MEALEVLDFAPPLIRLKAADVTAAGVARCARLKGALNGRPELEDGRLLDVQGIIWATGYRPDYGWIKLPIFEQDGYPAHQLGVVEQAPGLYFVGLHFQRALASPLLGAVDTHYHFDHSLGNSYYGANGIAVWAHANTAKRIFNSYAPMQTADRTTSPIQTQSRRSR